MTLSMKDYFDELNSKLERAYGVARSARAKNFDPEAEPEILPAKDIAARVEGIVGPPGIAEGIRKIGLDRPREEIAFDIVKEILEGKYADAKGAKDEDRLIDQAVRTGVAILTEGVLVAPTEGIAGIKRKRNPDGSEYLSLYFAGPIRSAGGTVAALSVVLADYARRHFKLAEYRPTETEIERYVEEINLYDVRAARLQHKPTDDEIRLIVKNCPVCIDGDPTEEFEVSVYKDIERIETNRIRGGMCLVVGEGIAQKASKVLKYTRKRGLDWSWLENLAKVTKGEGKTEIKPNPRFLEEIVAGRPVFAYPSAKGGFRLRYGRTRATGIAAKAIHPATMIILDSFPAIGTQLKLERPGKGCVVSPCDSIEGPIVELGDGSLAQISTLEEAERVKNDVRRIVFLGDILVSYGDFLRSNHPLIPSGYCEEFWLRELERAAEEKKLDIKKINANEISAEEAFKISETYGVPLHPKYTYFWHDISPAQLKELAEWLATGKLIYEWFKLKEFRVQSSPTKEILEMLGVPHKVNESFLVLDENHSPALLRSLGILQGRGVSLERFSKVLAGAKEGSKTLEIVNELAGVKIRERAPTYIGARMGRPEKAREREMKPSPNVLFPVGEAGGKLRSIMKAYGIAKERERYEGAGIMVEVARLRCPSCGDITILNRCDRCGVKTLPEYVCSRCGKTSRDAKNGRCSCGSSATPYDSRSINLSTIMSDALHRCGNSFSGDIKGVRGMTSECKIPEPLEKGILRAKHDVYVFKDGTSRFDATDVPLTHFYPNEIGVGIEKLKELGYAHDCEGKELTSETQLLELKPQDVVLSDRGADYLSRVARFVDDLLVYLYGLPPFYNVKEREDLLGQLVITLSPHTSCGVVGRIIGFTKARVGYTHPYMISARRRNCFS
ncbi:MAG: DNA polymerase II large subunit, partial [Candidatus Micrarchaeota archaeon]